MDQHTIHSFKIRAIELPLERPIRTAAGSIATIPLILIDVATTQGLEGRSYIFTYTPAVLDPLVRLIEKLAEQTVGKTVAPLERMREFEQRFRLLGWQGLIAMAVSGLDMAFWDILGRSAGVPLAQLLGGEAVPAPAYDSFGMVDPVLDGRSITACLDRGFKAIKIKIGHLDAKQDERIVRAVRDLIGPDTHLMVDYNQALAPSEAIRRIRRLEEFDLYWVEEPVRSDDIYGHAKVRASSAIPVQTGENWWFPREMSTAISVGACDFAMVDLMKIGGVTGWLRAAGHAEAASLPLSSHIFMEASAHLLAVSPTAHWIEHLDLAGPILTEPIQVEAGTISAKGPGLGMTWDEKAVSRFSL